MIFHINDSARTFIYGYLQLRKIRIHKIGFNIILTSFVEQIL